MDATLTLPDDPTILKQLLAQQTIELSQRDELLTQERMQQAIELSQRDELLAQRDAELSQRDAMIEQIKREASEAMEVQRQKHIAEVAAILRRFYGPKSERFDPAQLLLFGIVVDAMPLDQKAIEQEAGEPLKTRRIQHKHGRAKLPESLPRIPIEHDLAQEEKACPCCGKERSRIGSEVSEQLEYVPASFKVLQHIRYKYACKVCENNGDGPQIEIAIKPAQPIEKGLPGPGLLAYVITSKLADHLPLYRLENIFARLDVHIARSTLCAWIQACAELVKPLAELMASRVRQSKVIHTDETRLPVQENIPPPDTPPDAPPDTPKKRQCKNGRMWTYIGDEANPYIVYNYTPDRTRAGPAAWLANFKGYLQADAYGGYDGIYKRGNGREIIEVACWAHARRKFFDAQETDGRRCAEMLEMVRKLYDVEDDAKTQIAKLLKNKPAPPMTADEKHEIICDLRQDQSVPLLTQIKSWLDTEQKLVLPRSMMAEAIGYMLNQWEALKVYTTRGFLNIDNNAAERALKRIAIGRKNWLFASHDQSAESCAILTTLIASAQRHGVDPQAYLTGVLARIADTSVNQLDQFLPERWNLALDASV